MNANTIYTQNGIAAQKYIEETERLATIRHKENALAVERYMEETSISASLMYQES